MKNYVLLYSSCFQALNLACYPFISRLSCSLSYRLVLYDYGSINSRLFFNDLSSIFNKCIFNTLQSVTWGLQHDISIVYTVPLAIQQAKVIDKHTDLKVKHYIGEMGVDLWDKTVWQKEFNENNVLVMTALIFLNLLNHGYIKLSQVNLLIFDECHHAKKKHQYKQIMNFFEGCKTEDCPKVLGLTAAVIHRKVKVEKIESEIKKLECTLRSTCETSQDDEIEKFAAKPREEVVTFSNNRINNHDLNILVKNLQAVVRSGIDLLSELKDFEEALLELGPWAANRLAEHFVKGLKGMETLKTVSYSW